MSLGSIIRALVDRTRRQEPLIKVRISRSALLNNLRAYHDAYPGLAFAPVLKSNAYGHGLIPVAQILKDQNIPFFALDSLYEARKLRIHGIATPILIMGYTPTEQILSSRLNDVAFMVTNLSDLRYLGVHARRPIHLHLKVDTGMHRQGIMVNEVIDSIALLTAYPQLILDGVMSHLADADSIETSFTEKQLSEWSAVTKKYMDVFPYIPYLHTAASAGSAHMKNVPGNVVRLGLGLYGIDPSPNRSLPLTPALRIETRISTLRTLEVGESVGYNHTYTLGKRATIATIPMGYFEGIDRRLSNNGYVGVQNIPCQIIGRVSMNITSIDVSDVPACAVGDLVVAISDNRVDKNSIEEISHRTGTIPWEILVHIPQHLKRIIVD